MIDVYKIKTVNIYTVFTKCEVLVAILYNGTRREAHNDYKWICSTPFYSSCNYNLNLIAH